jgi:CHU_C Type IX secretion signal domain/SprB repeat
MLHTFSLCHLRNVLLCGMMIIACIEQSKGQTNKPYTIQEQEMMLCEKDTLYMAMIVPDSSLQEIFYQWQIKQDTAKEWQNLLGQNKSYLLQFPIQQAVVYRCKAAYSDACLQNADCEDFVQNFKVAIAPHPQLRYHIQAATCGEQNAAIELQIVGDKKAYQTCWNHKWYKQNLTHIPAGMYVLEVKDVWGCTTQDFIKVPVQSASPYIDLLVKPATCGINNGEIEVLNPHNKYYSYAWSTGEVTQHIQGLGVGKYWLQIKNSLGCKKDTIITISQVSLPHSFTIDAKNTDCDKANGQISIHIQGKGYPYRYLWNTGDTLATISHLAVGIYQVSITDKQGCKEESEPIEIQPIHLFKPRLKIHDVSCAGGNDGKIEAKVMGGDSLFLFRWSNGEVSPVIEHLTAGKYELEMLQKETTCVSTVTAEIKEPLPIEITLTDIPDSMLYALKIDVKGGNPPYIYALNEAENYQPFSIFDSLLLGNYVIFVQDDKGCTKSINYAITQSLPIDENLAPVFISNIISPNGDGKYDEFTIKSPNLSDAYIEIYNAQGDIIFENLMSENTWRGSADAAFCLPGVYYYFVELRYENGLNRDIKGSVRLIR